MLAKVVMGGGEGEGWISGGDLGQEKCLHRWCPRSQSWRRHRRHQAGFGNGYFDPNKLNDSRDLTIKPKDFKDPVLVPRLPTALGEFENSGKEVSTASGHAFGVLGKMEQSSKVGSEHLYCWELFTSWLLWSTIYNLCSAYVQMHIFSCKQACQWTTLSYRDMGFFLKHSIWPFTK